MSLISTYDAAFFDLDGVIYEGGYAIDGAIPATQKLYADGMPVAYLTNNASRSATVVAEHLVELGIPAKPEEVISSPDVAMDMLHKHLAPNTKVLVVGTDYLADRVNEAGFTAVRKANESPEAVLQGFSPDTKWTNVAEACFAIQAGARWFATNADSTLPRGSGIAPGNGAFIKIIAETSNHDMPEIAGKPEPAIFEYAMKTLGVKNPLMIGDRLDTDIEGGNKAGIDTCLVTTGVNTAADGEDAKPAQKPTHIITSLQELF